MLEYHLRYDTIYAREKHYISNVYDSFKDGMNSDKGGGGGPYRKLPLYDIAYLISLGANLEEVSRLISDAYPDSSISYSTVKKRVHEFWGSFYQAQEELLTPIIKKLLHFNYKGFDIWSTFKSASVADSYLAAWAQGKVSIKFPKAYHDRLTDSARINYVKKIEERSFYGIPVSKWTEWAIQGLSRSELNAMGISEESVKIVRKQLFEGDYQLKQIELRKIRTLRRLKEGWSFFDIFTKEFRRTYSTETKYSEKASKHRLRELFMSFLFPGMTMDEILSKAFE